MKLLYVMIISSLLFSSCTNNVEESVKPIETTSNTDANHKVKVAEVIQTSAYTYLFVNENDKEYWMAVSKRDSKVGDELYYTDAMEMVDFKSKELDRVFPSILFIQQVSDQPIAENAAPVNHQPTSIENHTKSKKASVKEEIKVEAAPDGITIAELYKNRANYAAKKVIVRGEIVKVNKGIMGKNWFHLQDGTEDSGNFDLTVTTLDENLNPGDIVTYEGVVTLNKDFGAGYSYELIMEEAVKK